MNRAIKIAAVLLMGMISGCSEDFTLPPGVLSYVNIAAFSTNEAFPQVAFDGTNYLVVYEDAITPTDHDIFAVLVSPGGTVITSVDIDPSSNDDRVPKVAFDGRNFLVVFQRITPAPALNQYIFGAFVSTAGVVQMGSPFPIDNSTNTNLAPAVAFNHAAATYLVVYQRTFSPTNHDILGRIVDTAGTVLGSPFSIDSSTNDDLAPEVATFPAEPLSDETTYLVVYQRTVTSTNHDIIGAIVDGAVGAVLGGSPFNIDISANDDTAPALAFGGTGYMAVYQRTISSTDHDIIGASVSTTGGAGAPFTVDGSSNDDLAPAVAAAYDDDEQRTFLSYLVAHQRTAGSSSHNIIGTRVNQAGSVLGTVAIDTTGFDDLLPALAFGNGNYLVAYEEVVTSENYDIFGAFVSR